MSLTKSLVYGKIDLGFIYLKLWLIWWLVSEQVDAVQHPVALLDQVFVGGVRPGDVSGQMPH